MKINKQVINLSADSLGEKKAKMINKVFQLPNLVMKNK